MGSGTGIQSNSAMVRANKGANKNKGEEEAMGLMGSLINSFRPSANGWSKP